MKVFYYYYYLLSESDNLVIFVRNLAEFGLELDWNLAGVGIRQLAGKKHASSCSVNHGSMLHVQIMLMSKVHDPDHGSRRQLQLEFKRSNNSQNRPPPSVPRTCRHLVGAQPSRLPKHLT